jgi:hypothetical protein
LKLSGKRTVQIGIRGAQNSEEGWAFSLESGMRVIFIEEFCELGVGQQTFSSPNVWKEMTAYEALHLGLDGKALLTEALVRFHGKQGKLIAYDLLRERRVEAMEGETGSVADFRSAFTSEPESANIFTAGLEVEIVHLSERELVQHVGECEWSRYFRERHPQVGYLLACSTDEVAHRTYNDRLRLQRTSTLMEGGNVCDFRIYAIDQVPDTL